MNHEVGSEIEQNNFKRPYLRQISQWQSAAYRTARYRLSHVSAAPSSQHPTKGTGRLRHYLFCSTVTSSRSLSLSTSAAWQRALCSVICVCSTLKSRLSVPASLKAAEAQRVCFPFHEWKKWNKDSLWKKHIKIHFWSPSQNTQPGSLTPPSITLDTATHGIKICGKKPLWVSLERPFPLQWCSPFPSPLKTNFLHRAVHQHLILLSLLLPKRSPHVDSPKCCAKLLNGMLLIFFNWKASGSISKMVILLLSRWWKEGAIFPRIPLLCT